MADQSNDQKADKKKVEEIHRLFVGIEQDSSDGKYDQMFLQELITQIGELSKSSDPILQKLSKYKDSLTPTMTLRPTPRPIQLASCWPSTRSAMHPATEASWVARSTPCSAPRLVPPKPTRLMLICPARRRTPTRASMLQPQKTQTSPRKSAMPKPACSLPGPASRQPSRSTA